MDKKRMIICTTIPSSFCFFRGQVQELKHAFEIKVLSSPGTEFDSFCSQEKVEGIRLAMRREISILRDIISLFRFVIIFIKERPDIIHANTPKASLLSLCAGWITRVPHRFYYVHGLRYEGTSGIFKTMLQFFERLSCLFATQIFSVGKGVRNTLVRDKITSKKAQIIFNGTINGIDSNHYCCENVTDNIRKHYGLSENDFILGFVGRIVKDKGMNELVSVFRDVSKNYPHAYLFLIGPYEENLDAISHETITEIQNNNQIICTGLVNDVRNYLNCFDVFLLPSYREGFNNAILEALAMGVPCICTDINGCNEAIESNRNGILIEPKCEESLAHAIDQVISDPVFLQKLKNYSRTSVVEKYKQEYVWEHSLKIYQNIVENNNVST